MTPYPWSDDDYENPSILASHDGIDWSVPTGLINPVDRVSGSDFNSDCELVIHGDTAYLFARTTYGGTIVAWVRTSTDGIHWSPRTVIETADKATDPLKWWISPSIRYHWGDGVWHLWYVHMNPGVSPNWTGPKGVVHRTATSPFGPWSEPTTCTLLNYYTDRDPWHPTVEWWNGAWRMALSDGKYGTTGGDGSILLASSADGLTWKTSPWVIDRGEAGNWDDDVLYRPTLVFDGDIVRVWYGALGMKREADPKGAWHIGLATVPTRMFPTP